MHCFDSVDAVLFIVAMSEYDQTLEEDHTINRMAESLNLFERISTMRWFAKAGMILFLNKKDVFEKKIKHSPLTACFSHYEGSSDKEEAATFISTEFEKHTPEERKVYHHYTCAKDPSNINFVFDAVMDVVFCSNLRENGLY